MDLQTIKERLRSLHVPEAQQCSKKEAAVLIGLFEDATGVVRVVLTQRSAHLRNHAGEVALPGGKRDPEDPSAVACALREANEEMGLEPTDVDVVACFAPVLSKHCLSVTPVIGTLPDAAVRSLCASPDEVDAIFDMPLHFFLEDDARHEARDAEAGRFAYRIHHFSYDQFEVWGLTAGILIRVAEAAFGREAEFDVVGPGVDYGRLYFDGKRVCLRGGGGTGAPAPAAAAVAAAEGAT